MFEKSRCLRGEGILWHPPTGYQSSGLYIRNAVFISSDDLIQHSKSFFLIVITSLQWAQVRASYIPPKRHITDGLESQNRSFLGGKAA
tara:strand:+ start:2166 stop:2429 length:264 start_codon:yes stop_codon:yes gene_type:complete